MTFDEEFRSIIAKPFTDNELNGTWSRDADNIVKIIKALILKRLPKNAIDKHEKCVIEGWCQGHMESVDGSWEQGHNTCLSEIKKELGI